MASRWNPDDYAAFRAPRLRPALDLLAQVPGLPEGAVVDLGCGDGAVAGALGARFPGRALIGVDNSAEMLARAKGYQALIEADIAGWAPEAPPALIFSNAALQWLGDHPGLMPRLAGFLPAGGVLAVQMPVNHRAPSHRLLQEVAARRFPDRFAPGAAPQRVAAPADYLGWLGGFGPVDLWETEYQQQLAPVTEGHPVRHFTGSTAMLPYLARLAAEERPGFIAAYDAALGEAYPALPGGGVLFPFRRFIFVLRRAG